MNVLVFSSLFPNNIWPNHGVFIKERISAIAEFKAICFKVVAPVPYFPPINISKNRWLFSQVRRQEQIEGLDVSHPRYFMIPKVGMALQGIMMFLSILPAIKRILREFPFDLIDSHYVYPDGFVAVLLGWVFKKPVIVSARGSDINQFQTFPVIRKFLLFTLKKADKVITVSKALKETMVSLGVPGNKVFVIPNGVDADKFYPFDKAEAKAQLKLSNKRVILSVGNLTHNKGFDLVIRAFHLLKNDSNRDPLYLVIVGEGGRKESLQVLINSLQLQKSVHLAGVVPQDRLFYWYSAADMLCLASEREGWPNVLLESLSCGTPVVATKVGGIPEIIRSKEVGILTDRTSESLASGMGKCLRQSWDSEVLRSYAGGHSWEKVAQSVIDVFESVTRSS